MAFSLTPQQPGLSTPTAPMSPAPAGGVNLNPSFSLPPTPPTTGYNVQLPDVVPSPVFDSQFTAEDVFSKRNQFQNQIDTKANNQATLQTLYSNLMAGNMTGLVNRPMSTAGTMRDQLLGGISSATQNFATGYQDRITAAYDRAGVGAANDNLSNIQEQIGDRQVQQRQDLRKFEQGPYRGVARSFYEGERNSINKQANEELADLALQEIAASGRYDRALEMANQEIDQQSVAFDQEIAAYQAQLDALAPTLDQEDKLFADTLRFQLDQVKAQADQQRDDRKAVVETSMEAAANGAPQDLVYQIANAQSPEEAAGLAADWIGRQDRLTQEAQRANIWDQIRSRKATSASTTTNAKTQAGLDRAQTVLQTTAEAIASVDPGGLLLPGNTGVGAFAKFIPGSSARVLASKIDTIKANLGFAELQAMRDASPTGGALGQVAIQELTYLQAALTNLDQGLPEEELVHNLNKVTTHFTNWVQAVGAAEGRHYEIASGLEGIPDGTIIEITE